MKATNVSIQHTIPPFAPTVCGLKKWVKFKDRAKRVGFTGGGAVSCPWTSHVRPWGGQWVWESQQQWRHTILGRDGEAGVGLG